MNNKLLLLTSIFFTFISCEKEDRPIKTIEQIKEKLNSYDSIYVYDKSDNTDLEKEITYIFKAMEGGNQYAYSDLLIRNNGNLLLTCALAPQITDFTRQDIIISESKDKGASWTRGNKIEHLGVEKYINSTAPSIIKINEDHFLLFFLIKYSETRIDIMFKESFDGGDSWGEDQIVYEKNVGYQTINNNRVLFVNNRLIIPVAIPERKDDLMKSIESAMSVYLLISDDLGKTWRKSSTLSFPGLALLEPGIEYVGDNELLMNIRLNIGGILFARSKDFGNSWKFEVSNFQSPSSPQKIMRINGTNRLIMLWNNNNIDVWKHWGNRNPLSLALSNDGGRTWEFISHIEDNKGYDYSYPSISQDSDYIYITYFELSQLKGYALKLVKIKRSDLINVKL